MTGFATRALVSGALLLSASAGWAQTGSGTVEFRFVQFAGPAQLTFPAGLVAPGDPETKITGTVNGQRPELVDSISVNPPANNPVTWEIGTLNLRGSSSVTLIDDERFTTPETETKFSWAPADFSNVPIGQDFVLGTLTFQNGTWFGGAADPSNNQPTRLTFTVETFSSTGNTIFNQRRDLALIHTVFAPFPNDTTTLAGQDAAADIVTLFDRDSGMELSSFRVYDLNQTPAGFTNVGTVDLIGRFGSLDIIGFANPVGGFLTAGSGPLPPVPPGGGGGGGGGGGTPGIIPEPASWAMMIVGFGLVGGVMRRRREALAA